MDSHILTTELMYYLRFIRKCYLVAPEVKYNRSRSDVLAVLDKKIYEFEVKVSKSDLKRDFDKTLTLGWRATRRKVAKHMVYTSSTENGPFVPHYFSFAVPPELETFALEICKEYPAYGVFVWDPSAKGHMRAAKAPRALNNEPLNRRVAEKILKRATSDMVFSRLRMHASVLTIPDEDSDEMVEQTDLALQ